MKNIKIFLILLFPFFIFSCGSTKIQNEQVESLKNENIEQESVEKDKSQTTFVNTVFSEDGKIYTTCIFSEVTYIGKLAEKDGNYDVIEKTGGIAILKENFDYDSKNGEVILKNDVDKDLKNIFHIKGIYENPPIFVLNGNVHKNPLIMLEGKLLIRNVDYEFDEKSSIIRMKEKFDLNEDSFYICWATKKRECSFVNKYEKYREEYEKIIDKWNK